MKLRSIFILLVLLLTFAIIGIDLLHLGPTDLQTFLAESTLGSIFAAQTLAVICVALIAFFVPMYRNSRLRVGSLVVATVIVVAGAYMFYAQGPRIITEADGPASVGYYCTLGELYSTTSSEALCFFKNQPLAISNIVGSKMGFFSSGLLPTLRQTVSLGILETAVAALTISSIAIATSARRSGDKTGR
jgi:hypothetical protein